MKHSIIFSVLIIFAFMGYSKSVPMAFTLYSNDNYTGNSITVDQTHRDFLCVSNVLGGVLSFCYTGAWHLTKRDGTYTFYPTSSRNCLKNHAGYENVTSVTRAGPVDTATPAISFVTSSVANVIDKVAEANLNVTSGMIAIYRVYTTGFSNWTIFESKNFEGRQACVLSPAEINYYSASSLGLPSIGSVIKNCNLDPAYVNEMRQEQYQNFKLQRDINETQFVEMNNDDYKDDGEVDFVDL